MCPEATGRKVYLSEWSPRKMPFDPRIAEDQLVAVSRYVLVHILEDHSLSQLNLLIPANLAVISVYTSL